MEANVARCESCNNCENSGLQELNARVSKIPFKSGNYSDKETCYWYIYAPSASEIRITIDEVQVIIDQIFPDFFTF